MATCAICQQPATRAQGIALAGTEVFHKDCVRRYGTTNSVVNRLRLQLAELEARAVRELELLRQRMLALEDENKALHRSETKSRDEREDAKRALIALEMRKLELAAANGELRQMRENYRLLERDFERMADERDAARREAALHQVIGGQNVTVSSSANVTPAKEDTRDDTEIRFSLLELDESK